MCVCAYVRACMCVCVCVCVCAWLFFYTSIPSEFGVWYSNLIRDFGKRSMHVKEKRTTIKRIWLVLINSLQTDIVQNIN